MAGDLARLNVDGPSVPSILPAAATLAATLETLPMFQVGCPPAVHQGRRWIRRVGVGSSGIAATLSFAGGRSLDAALARTSERR